MITAVIVDFNMIGYHRYEAAPPLVYFLRTDHRHVFRIRAAFPVVDPNREIEIFSRQQVIIRYIQNTYPAMFDGVNFGPRSCEMIAQELQKQFGAQWVEVFEDGQGGARCDS